MLFPSLVIGQDCFHFSYEDTPLNLVIQDLENKLDIVFSYTADQLDSIKLSASGKDKSKEQVLDIIFSETDLEYQFYDDNYVVITRVFPKEISICVKLKNSVGEPLSFATLYAPNLQVGTNGTVDGSIKLEYNMHPEEDIEISYIGYETLTLKAKSLLDCPELIMKVKEFSFAEVIVKDYVTGGIEQSVDLDHMILRPGQLSVVPGLTDADVLQMIQILPGVESVDESASGLSVRGGTSDQNLILYDGIPIYNSGHFFGMISAFNPSIVDKVNVYLSGFGANFGGRVSSVIDITSTEKIPERINWDMGINFTHGDLSLTLPFNDQKMAFIIGARKSYNDIIETPTYQKLSQRVFRKGKFDEVEEEADNENIDFTLGFDFNDYNLKYIFKPNDKDFFSASFFQVDDKLDFNFIDTEDNFSTNDKLDLSNTGIGIQWERIWSTKFWSKLKSSYTELSNDYRFSIVDNFDGEADVQTVQVNDITDKTFVIENNWAIVPQFCLNFGVQFSDLKVKRKWQFEEDDQEVDEITDINRIYSGFVSLNSAFKNKFRTELGLRLNYADATKEHFLEPRLSWQYLPSDKFQIKGSAGLYRQFMNQVIEFNDLGLNQDFWVLADDEESTPISKSQNFTLGFLLHPKSFQFEIEGYYKFIEGLTSNFSEFEIDMESDFDEGNGKTWGLNLMFKKRYKSYQTWMSYSFNKTQYTFDLDLEEVSFKAPHDRPHSLTFMNQLELKNWTLSLSWKLASGVRYTSTSTLAVEEDDAFPLFSVDDINAETLPVFHRLDASFMYQFDLGNDGLSAKLGFSFLNLYNRQNILSREYFTIYNEETESYTLEERNRDMLRFTPNIVFRLQFE